MWKEPWGFSTRIFEEMDKEFAELSRLFSSIQESGSSADGRLPYYYGYQVTVGPDGKPHVREFGNVRPSSKGLVGQVAQTHPSVREPLVDAILDEKQNTLVITAEMPGITKEDVKIHLGQGEVTIDAEKGEKKYHKTIPVEHELDENSAKAAYTNGIVELKIKLKAPSKKKAKEVKVE